MEEKIITSEQVEQRLINKPKEQWTKDDVFDRYIGYGSPEEIEDSDVQKLFIKYGLYEELINLVNNVITDKEVVEKILNSNIFEKKELKKIKGKIKDIKILEIEDENIDELKEVLIIFEKEDTLKQIKIKDFVLTSNTENYLKDRKKYNNTNITAIVEKKDANLILKCLCTKDNGKD